MWILCGLVASWTVQGVVGQKLEAYFPKAAHAYSLRDGIPDPCVRNVVVDSLGRIFVSTCFLLPSGSESSIYLLGENRVIPRGPVLHPNLQAFWVQSVHHNRMFYGVYEYVEDDDMSPGYAFFTFDPARRKFFHYVPPAMRNAVINGQEYHRDTLYAAGRIGDSIVVFRVIDSSRADILLTILADEMAKTRGTVIDVTDDAIWLSTSTGMLRWSRAGGGYRIYPLPKGMELKSGSRYLFADRSGALWVFNKMGKNLARWNARREIFELDPDLVNAHSADIRSAFLANDNCGNLLTGYYMADGSVQATLRVADGTPFDYSPVMSLVPDATPVSADFTRSIVMVKDGYTIVDVTRGRSVEASLPLRMVRSVVDIGGGAVMVSTNYADLGRWDASGFHPGRGPQTVNLRGDVEWQRARDGRIWMSSHQGVPDGNDLSPWVRYDPGRDHFEIFPCSGPPPEQFCVAGDGRIIAASRGRLYTWREGDKTLRDIPNARYAGTATHLLLESKDVLWLATTKGLYRVNRRSGSAEAIRFTTDRVGVQRLCRDTRGRLWLGTTSRGLFVIDSTDQVVFSVDKSKGLLNNIVTTMLEDDSGILWVGTYDGINLISPEGQIIGKVTAAHGLISNECNRWSACRTSDGRLFFGSVLGLSVIDPVQWKARNLSQERPYIFLTALTSRYGEETTDIVDHLPALEAGQRIELPAANRNISASFMLTRYASPEINTYAYTFSLPGSEWQYLGTESTVVLNALPPGSYDLIIRGMDGNGNWSDPPLVVPLQVRRFFYQQWWFYTLCAFPFVILAWIWLRQQRKARLYLEREVLHRTATIRDQAARLEEMDHVKTRLYTNITHEFRTPLTVILGLANTLRRSPASQDVGHAAELIHRNGDSLLDLVNQMLDLRKLESGAMPLHLVQDDIVRFVRYLAESFRPMAEARQLHFRLLTELESMYMDFDPEKVRQVIANLVSNAIKFTPAHGEVYLQLDHHQDLAGEQLAIRVKDTGIGIPADRIGRIFEQFYQVDDSHTRRGEGTGIGLTLAMELVRLMGGTLNVTSQMGLGTTFTFSLPVTRLAPGPMDSEDMAGIGLSLPVGSSPAVIKDPTEHISDDPGKPKVMIVEDNPDVIHYLIACLEPQYAVRIAMDGQEGMDAARDEIPDAIISDIMMPVKDGLALCRELKEDIRTSHIPIILLTAKADQISLLEGLRHGADAYLAKPFDAEELRVRLRQLLDLRKRLHARYSLLSAPIIEQDGEPQPEDAFMGRFAEAVDRFLDDDTLDGNQLSVTMGLSRSQLHRKLKAITGKSTMEAVRDIRLARSRELLADPGKSISEVAYAVGFKYPETFSRAFSDAFGESPSSWRARTANGNITGKS